VTGESPPRPSTVRSGRDRRQGFGRRSTDAAPLRSRSVDILLSVVAALSSIIMSVVVYEFLSLKTDYTTHKGDMQRLEVEMIGVRYELRAIRDGLAERDKAITTNQQAIATLIASGARKR
jgi:heme/copper-type cytochrome/quinol oxidase subunit 2